MFAVPDNPIVEVRLRDQVTPNSKSLPEAVVPLGTDPEKMFKGQQVGLAETGMENGILVTGGQEAGH